MLCHRHHLPDSIYRFSGLLYPGVHLERCGFVGGKGFHRRFQLISLGAFTKGLGLESFNIPCTQPWSAFGVVYPTSWAHAGWCASRVVEACGKWLANVMRLSMKELRSLFGDVP